MTIGIGLLHEARRLGLEVFSCHGDEAVARCPMCGKERHLYFNHRKKVYDCKHCGMAGTYLQLCEALCKQASENFTEAKKTQLANDRGIPPSAFDGYEIGVCDAGFLLPVRDLDGTLRDLRQYSLGHKSRSTAGLTVGLFGAPRLAVPEHKEYPVYLCEGEWDAIAFEFLRMKVHEPGVVVGVPGANIFKDEWRSWFKGRNVFLCFDYDEAGRLGQARAANKLASIARTVQVLEWPSDTLDKTDVRDLVKEVFTHEN